jgi:hypothetical protein
MRCVCTLALSLGFASAVSAQSSVYQTQPKQSFRFTGDSLVRYEWTRDIPSPDGKVDEDRYRLQLRPRVELNLGPIELGAGAEFNYSDDENDEPPEGLEFPPIIRDNYRSRDARADLYYARAKVGPMVAEGGRFFMPIALTEMIWDHDLRPLGGAVTFETAERGVPSRIAVTGLYAERSHIFDDESYFFGGSLDFGFGTGPQSAIRLVGSYLEFRDLELLSPPIQRQNTRVAGMFVNDYRVVDVVGRLTTGGRMPLQLVADYCWNTAADESNRGLWLAVVMGAFGTSRAVLEYTYAKIDKDATVAAYNTDDFFWNTGWEGHRADIGTGMGPKNSVHAVAQWQRFKDSPDPAQREEWVQRFRIEWRSRF